MPTTRFHLPDPPLCPPEPVFLTREEREDRSPSLLYYLLPTHWACYFLHDDPSGLDEAEIAAADAWWQQTFAGGHASCVDADEEYGYTASHDASGFCGATDCTIYSFRLHPAAPAQPAGACAPQVQP
ncbi:MAG: hypothetical protein ER33_08975 [Cyanobium sp. CACIAM 14]|nr:MAG: hypothetical protein ER33_08975 [Cyanobium sp. CACIAM 14]